MNVSLAAWIATVVAIGVLFAVDLLNARRPHEVSAREALTWVGAYVVLAGLFAAGVGVVSGGRYATEFVAGWLTEYSLSVDNLFVFALLLGAFGVPTMYRARVLLVGVAGALVLRGACIAAGAAALSAFHATYYLFGAFLLFTAVQLLRGGEVEADPEHNLAVRTARRVMPVTAGYRGTRLTVREDGRRAITPMLLVIVAVMTTDVVFALDSIPTIFGLTREAYIVFTANAFALLGLRQLFFVLAGLLDWLRYLGTGLAVVLAFIGVKLILEAAHERFERAPVIPLWLSLGVIVLSIGTAVLVSLRAGEENATDRTSPGTRPQPR